MMTDRAIKTVETMAETATKTHDEIVAGWDSLLKNNESESYNYYWNKGYTRFKDCKPYEVQQKEEDNDAYRDGWLEAKDKFRMED